MTLREKAIETLREREADLKRAEHSGNIHTIVQVYADGDITITKTASASECSILCLEDKARVLHKYGGFGSCSCDICADGEYDPANDYSDDSPVDVLEAEIDRGIEIGWFDDETE